ncbi:MAG TPA: GTP cyclohydrolase II RibA [Mycobacteriales bacterium]|nr:GTP cyclohydrolase II RibA [Mycobacteriales bacterium]
MAHDEELGETPAEVAAVGIPTPFGEFLVRAFVTSGGHVYLALVKGEIAGGRSVLTRLHSECLTGDALGSLRCDCGIQLRTAVRAVAAEGRGVVLYVTGHEGRGVGLVNKLRAYVEQDRGADTVDANLRLGLPPDNRDYSDAGSVLEALGVRSVRLLSNNGDKADGLRRAGIQVDGLVPLATATHLRNRRYIRTKELRFGHVQPAGADLVELPAAPSDVTRLLGEARPRPDRPYVLVKYAQTVDGRIATGSGDSKWISGEDERRVSHALRAACDAVLVGVGTVLQDDPHLTVRLVPGASPIRVVLDSTLNTPLDANVLSDDAATIVVTTTDADERRRAAFAAAGVTLHAVSAGARGVDVGATLALLRSLGIESLMVEGGSAVITSLFGAGVVDRLVVSLSPTIIGSGVEAVGSLGIRRITEGLRLVNRCVHVAGEDVLFGWDVRPAR